MFGACYFLTRFAVDMDKPGICISDPLDFSDCLSPNDNFPTLDLTLGDFGLGMGFGIWTSGLSIQILLCFVASTVEQSIL